MRTPRANLESLYGGGPVGSPYLYARADPAKLLARDGDLPRNQEGIALIGDPRNDVHMFMNQMQVAFVPAHNLLVDRLREDGVAEAELFDEARRALTWHYQWVIVNEFLPVLVGAELVDELLADGAAVLPTEGEPYIPVEFADAAYRYGHSQIRQLYRLQPTAGRVPVFPDLVGFGPIADRRVDWSLLFDVPGAPPAQRAKPDRRPAAALADRAAPGDHRRGRARRLPLARGPRPRARPGHRAAPGEAVARLIGADAADRRRGRLAERVDGRDAAVALHPARGSVRHAATGSARSAAGSSRRS